MLSMGWITEEDKGNLSFFVNFSVCWKYFIKIFHKVHSVCSTTSSQSRVLIRKLWDWEAQVAEVRDYFHTCFEGSWDQPWAPQTLTRFSTTTPAITPARTFLPLASCKSFWDISNRISTAFCSITKLQEAVKRNQNFLRSNEVPCSNALLKTDKHPVCS